MMEDTDSPAANAKGKGMNETDKILGTRRTTARIGLYLEIGSKGIEKKYERSISDDMCLFLSALNLRSNEGT